MEKETITVDLVAFRRWQAQMARASAKAANDPDDHGKSVHRAHEEMREVLREYHEDR